jgi:GMC oxidoreductase
MEHRQKAADTGLGPAAADTARRHGQPMMTTLLRWPSATGERGADSAIGTQRLPPRRCFVPTRRQRRKAIRAIGGVVDGHGRVYGLDGPLVADASIMPTIARANTTSPRWRWPSGSRTPSPPLTAHAPIGHGLPQAARWRESAQTIRMSNTTSTAAAFGPRFAQALATNDSEALRAVLHPPMSTSAP